MAHSSTSPVADSPAQAQPLAAAQNPPGLREYAVVSGALAALGAGLWALVRGARGVGASPHAVLAPMLSMVLVVAVAWCAMLIVRNYAVLAGISDGAYYVTFRSHLHPADWVERPARTFNNLMQLPTLFYLVCVLMMFTGRVDLAQVRLAWVFVGLRALHALIYTSWNFLPARFGSYVAGFVTLCVIWVRFASAAWDLIAP